MRVEPIHMQMTRRCDSSIPHACRPILLFRIISVQLQTFFNPFHLFMSCAIHSVMIEFLIFSIRQVIIFVATLLGRIERWMEACVDEYV